MTRQGLATLGTLVICLVQTNVHEIGKDLVGIMLSGVGIEVIDLGIDVPPAKFAQAIEEYQPQIVGISALLTTTMGQFTSTIDALTEAGLRVTIMVDGAPVTAE